VTFGFRVPLATAGHPTPTREGQPYPRVLEERLRAAGNDVEVIAMAVPGYSSHQGLAWARRDLHRFEPDLVVIAFGWNDASAMPASDHDAMPVGAPYLAARWLLLRSQAALRIARALRSHDPVAGLPPALKARVPQERYVANVRDIVREAMRAGAAALVLGPVYRRRRHRQRGGRVAASRRALAEAMRADGTRYEDPGATEAGASGNAGCSSSTSTRTRPGIDGSARLWPRLSSATFCRLGSPWTSGTRLTPFLRADRATAEAEGRGRSLAHASRSSRGCGGWNDTGAVLAQPGDRVALAVAGR
jgi:lysophospholipase L1-like esterase